MFSVAELTSVNNQSKLTEVVQEVTQGMTVKGNFEEDDQLCWSSALIGVPNNECVGGAIRVALSRAAKLRRLYMEYCIYTCCLTTLRDTGYSRFMK